MNIEKYIIGINEKVLVNIANEVIDDFNSLPLFYLPNSLSILEDLNFLKDLKSKLNKFYSFSCGYSYDIPYDFISNREAVVLTVEDLMIKYILKKSLEEFTNHKLILPEQFDVLISDFINKANERSSNVFKIDILNYYDSISHEVFLNTLVNHLVLDINSDYYILFQKSLQIVYKNKNNQIVKKEKGLSLGIKPDEYFANYFIYRIVENIKIQHDIELLYVADEIFFSASNLNQARIIFEKIENTLLDFKLLINKNKNTTINFSIKNLQIVKNLLLTTPKYDYDRLFDEFMNGKERSIFYIKENKKIIDPKKDENECPMCGYYNEKECPYCGYQSGTYNPDEYEGFDPIKLKEIENFEINNYEDSFNFLKILMVDKEQIKKYQKTFPDYSKLYNITSSIPTESQAHFNELDLYIFNKKVIEKLLFVIYRYPRSEYYTALAIDILVYIAKNSTYCGNCRYEQDNMDMDLNLLPKLTDACELSNLSIIDLLESEDIHAFQKYLILRSLFKNDSDLNFSINNYQVKQILFSCLIDTMPKLPFTEMVIDSIKRLYNTSNNFALNAICLQLIKIIDN